MTEHPHTLPGSRRDVLEPHEDSFYRQGLVSLQEAQIPFLVGGAYALERYTGIVRRTKDIDIFIYPRDCDRAFQVLSTAGYHTNLTFPHWLGKAFRGEYFIDIIFNSGNGLCPVDNEWFEHAPEDRVLDIPVRLCPPEEIIWTKAFIEERERYDGADIAHILRACGRDLAWPRLLRRFGTHWRLFLSHLVLFGFIYPSERSQIPSWVIQDLLYRLQTEQQSTPPEKRLCQGTLLSREQYLIDIMRWGYRDARLIPEGAMTQEEIDHWTAAIEEKR
jgi:hypothetical protein